MVKRGGIMNRNGLKNPLTSVKKIWNDRTNFNFLLAVPFFYFLLLAFVGRHTFSDSKQKTGHIAIASCHAFRVVVF
jgi:hypothetical protein